MSLDGVNTTQSTEFSDQHWLLASSYDERVSGQKRFVSGKALKSHPICVKRNRKVNVQVQIHPRVVVDGIRVYGRSIHAKCSWSSHSLILEHENQLLRPLLIKNFIWGVRWIRLCSWNSRRSDPFSRGRTSVRELWREYTSPPNRPTLRIQCIHILRQHITD